jgi:hypothetical protein
VPEENERLITDQEIAALEKSENIPLFDDEDLIALGETFDESQ